MAVLAKQDDTAGNRDGGFHNKTSSGLLQLVGREAAELHNRSVAFGIFRAVEESIARQAAHAAALAGLHFFHAPGFDQFLEAPGGV